MTIRSRLEVQAASECCNSAGLKGNAFLTDAEKAEIVRSFFELADAMAAETEANGAVAAQISESERKLAKLVEKHSDPNSKKYLKNIWKEEILGRKILIYQKNVHLN